MQRDGLVEQRAQLAIQALEQVAAGDGQIKQRPAQLRGDIFRGLGGEQPFDVSGRCAHLLALLIDVELIKADVGDLVSQAFVQFQVRQRLFLLVENLGQQQAAAQHVDLLAEGLIGLRQVIQLLLGLEVLLGQLVETVGAAQQVIRQLEVGRAFGRQQAAAAGFLRFQRQVRYGFLRLGATLVVDQGLQVLNFLLLTGDFFGQQVVLAVAQVLQLAVAGQFLAAQQVQRVDRGQFRVEQIALIGAQGFAVVFAILEDGVDLLDACLIGADFSLRPFWPGLRGDGQAVGFVKLALQITLLSAALAEQLLQLRHIKAAVALRDRNDLAFFQPGQLALVVRGLFRRLSQLLLKGDQLLFAVVFTVEKRQRLLKHLLQGLLVGIRQFAVGNLVEALLHGIAGGRLGGQRREGRQAKRKQCGSTNGTQGKHRHRSHDDTCGLAV
ncbi:hypothetical protein ALP75_200358 [Pseudomonas syringae pv. actinidiae]|nr:hypothetical protein ALP75_200358 [Pseudomonas syringae pv. actinidiae]